MISPRSPFTGGFVAALLLAAGNLYASSLFIDCGSGVPSGGTTVNNLTSGALNASLSELTNDIGATTGISLTVTDSFHALSSLSNGFIAVTGDAISAGFTGSMAQDYLLINNLIIDEEINSQATIRFSGLSAGQSYTLTILSSRDASPATGPRILDATLTGETSVSGFVDATANNSAVITLTTTAAVGGTLDCTFTARSGGNAAVNALKLTLPTPANDVPGASLITGSGAPRVGGLLTGTYLYSDADADAESGTATRWERADDASGTGVQTIAGATGATYTLQPADAGKYLRYVVTPGAASGPTPGFASHSPWNGPVAAAGAVTTFHIGNSFTRWGNVPQQVINLAAAAGAAHAGRGQLTDTRDLAYQWANRQAGSVVQEGVPSGPELATGTWDNLVLQPRSQEWQQASLASFTTNAQNFYNLADSIGTRAYLYAYWPYLSEPTTVQASIDAAFEQVRAAISTGSTPARIIPVGAAFKAVTDGISAGTISGITRDNLYQDDLHPSTLGYYLSSLVHYATLRQQSPVGLPAQGISADPLLNDPVAIDPALAAKFQAIAWDTARYLGTSGVTAGRFATWAQDLPAGQQGTTDTPFGDGVSNLARFAFGLSKTGPDPGTGRFPQWATAPGGQLAVEYRLGADAEDAGVITLQQWSNDLVNWTQPPPAGLLTTRSGELVRLEFPTSALPVFFRVRAVLP